VGIKALTNTECPTIFLQKRRGIKTRAGCRRGKKREIYLTGNTARRGAWKNRWGEKRKNKLKEPESPWLPLPPPEQKKSSSTNQEESAEGAGEKKGNHLGIRRDKQLRVRPRKKKSSPFCGVREGYEKGVTFPKNGGK